jgi:hypothetical protein
MMSVRVNQARSKLGKRRWRSSGRVEGGGFVGNYPGEQDAHGIGEFVGEGGG